MPITIGSNTASIAAQRQLARTGSELASVFERLSSGQRVNRASDDAAGLAVSDSLNARSRVYTKGIKNLNDGLSLLSIADSAVEQLGGIVARLTELAEQAANGSYSPRQRRALDTEAQALSDEYSRIQQSTSFNGLRLFDGSVQNLRLQGGYGEDGGIAEGLGGAIGTGTFAARRSYTGAGSAFAVATGDFNGDGFVDLATSDFSASTVSIRYGLGDGSLSAATSFGVGSSPYAVIAADLNGDGVLDLVNADDGSNRTSVLIGRGDGTFLSRVSYASGKNPRSVATTDLNGDGALDIVTAAWDDNAVTVMLGRGNGTFGTAVSFSSGAGPTSVVSGDVNGDGLADVVSADSAAAVVSVFLGRGDGTLAARVSFATVAGVSSVTLDDLNGDGRLDIAASGGSVSVLLGRGDGTFNTQATYSSGVNPHSIVSGDFNGDGIADLASVGIFSTANILIGRGDGTFNSAVSYATGTRAYGLASADFNRDGVLDLASANLSQVNMFIGNTQDGVAPLLPFTLRTIADSRQALTSFRDKGERLAIQRGELGAFQSRVGVAVNVLQVSAENSKAAESRIRDADIAEESSRSIRLSILQQAGSAVLAQANQQPALALKLLSGMR